jgi:hypothetical protein
MTASFGKDFGSMTQGDEKTGTTGTNAMFIMNPEDVPHIPKNQPPMYAKVVIAHQPQKEDLNCVQITAGGNLMNYPGELTTRTANITTAKLHWNSILSTPKAKYICLDIGNFYLSATLNRYEYMKMPITLFPPRITKQYCTFDPDWQPSPWMSRISCSSHLDYCRAGQKNKKSYLGHGSVMIIGRDMFGCRLLNKKHLYLSYCHFNFKLLEHFF